MKQAQVQKSIKILSELITPYPGEIGLASAVLITHIDDLNEEIKELKIELERTEKARCKFNSNITNRLSELSTLIPK